MSPVFNVNNIASGAGPVLNTSGFLLRDDFITDRLAGAINSTPAEPGPGTRTVRDVESKMSISSGLLNIVAQVTAVSPEEDITYANIPITRIAGRMLLTRYSATVDGLGAYSLNWVNSATPTITGKANVDATFQMPDAGIIVAHHNAATGPWVGLIAVDGTFYALALILRAVGAMWFIKGGTYTNWTLLYIASAGNSATLYANMAGFDCTSNRDFIRVPVELWLPTPFLSTTGAMTWPTTNGIGHAEGIAGGVGAGGRGVVFVDTLGTWGTNGTVISSSALDASGKSIATTLCSSPDVHGLCTLARSAGNVGNVWRYIDADNYLFSYHDGTNFVLKQRLAGAETTLITGAAAIGAGAMQINLLGTAGRLYLNNALINTTASIDAIFSDVRRHGFYTTNIGNTFNNFVVYPAGTERQHAVLDVWTN